MYIFQNLYLSYVSYKERMINLLLTISIWKKKENDVEASFLFVSFQSKKEKEKTFSDLCN